MRRSPRLGTAVSIAVGGLGAMASLGAFGGCTVGDGSGSAAGLVWITGCNPNEEPPADYGSAMTPAAFSLDPTFFAGDPIEGTSSPPKNRLTIRMQRNGTSVELNDTLYFDVLDSYEVARCIRGSTMNGVENWDHTDMGLGPWCDWTGLGFGGSSPTDAGATTDAGAGATADAGAPDAGAGATTLVHARIHLTSQGYMQSSFSPLGSCPLNPLKVVGAALVGHSYDGWIEFIDFGAAAQPQIPSAQRPLVDPAFKVNFGERLRASFHSVLGDDRVLTAQQTQPSGGPVPAPLMSATLDGNFDFDLVRGRAAQPFP